LPVNLIWYEFDLTLIYHAALNSYRSKDSEADVAWQSYLPL
jgi:hypothetical protein